MAQRGGAPLTVVAVLVARTAVAEPPALAAEAQTIEAKSTAEPAAAAAPTAPPVAPAPDAASTEGVTRLVLSWPIAPREFTFSEARPVVPLQWDGAPYTFEAEAVWVEEGAFSLRTIGASEEKLELDCRITCRPMIEQSTTVEARLSLGSPGKVVPETYGFLRTKVAAPDGQGFASPRSKALLQVGLGGFLDL